MAKAAKATESESKLSQRRFLARLRPLLLQICRWVSRLRPHQAIGRELSLQRVQHLRRIQILHRCMYRLYFLLYLRTHLLNQVWRIPAWMATMMGMKITLRTFHTLTSPGSRTDRGYCYYVVVPMIVRTHCTTCLKRRRTSNQQTMILPMAHNLISWTTLCGTHFMQNRPRWNT